MNFLTSEYRMKQFGHIVCADEKQWALYEEELATIQARIEEIEVEYAKTISSDTDRELYDTAILAWDYYVEETGEKIISLSRTGQLDAVNEIMLGNAKLAFEIFQDTYDQLVDFNIAGADNASAYATKVFWFVLVAVLLVAILAFLFIRCYNPFIT